MPETIYLCIRDSESLPGYLGYSVFVHYMFVDTKRKDSLFTCKYFPRCFLGIFLPLP